MRASGISGQRLFDISRHCFSQKRKILLNRAPHDFDIHTKVPMDNLVSHSHHPPPGDFGVCLANVLRNALRRFSNNLKTADYLPRGIGSIVRIPRGKQARFSRPYQGPQQWLIQLGIALPSPHSQGCHVDSPLAFVQNSYRQHFRENPLSDARLKCASHHKIYSEIKELR